MQLSVEVSASGPLSLPAHAIQLENGKVQWDQWGLLLLSAISFLTYPHMLYHFVVHTKTEKKDNLQCYTLPQMGQDRIEK